MTTEEVRFLRPADRREPGGIIRGIPAVHGWLQPVSREILLAAAGLRARYRLRTPDAIQIATGLEAGATLAITNDETWRSVPLIEAAILSDLD